MKPRGPAAETTMDAGTAELPLSRSDFMRDVLTGITTEMEAILGAREASGYVSSVGAAVGRRLGGVYRDALGPAALDRETVARVLCDLKARVGGAFEVVAVTEDKIVLNGHACPFGLSVIGHPSLCQMTTHVFGRIVADNLGYARVGLTKTIAGGESYCQIEIALTPSDELGPNDQEFFSRAC